MVTQRVANCCTTLLRQFRETKKKVTVRMGIDVGEVWLLSLGGFSNKYISQHQLIHLFAHSIDLASPNQLNEQTNGSVDHRLLHRTMQSFIPFIDGYFLLQVIHSKKLRFVQKFPKTMNSSRHQALGLFSTKTHEEQPSSSNLTLLPPCESFPCIYDRRPLQKETKTSRRYYIVKSLERVISPAVPFPRSESRGSFLSLSDSSNSNDEANTKK